jgi:membrane protease YdiL (CAAX protease family)
MNAGGRKGILHDSDHDHRYGRQAGWGLRRARGDLAFFLALVVVWAVCAKTFWYSPVNGLLETGLGRTGADLLLRAINVAVWLGFAGAYLRATSRPLSYLKLWHNAPKGLTVGSLIGLAFVAKDLVRATLLGGLAPDFAGLRPLTFLSAFVEEVVFRGLVLQRAGEYMGFWKANALSAGLFVGVHVRGWIFSGVPLPGIASSAAFVLVLALVLGYLLKRTGSLWACVVCHAMSNWGATL